MSSKPSATAKPTYETSSSRTNRSSRSRTAQFIRLVPVVFSIMVSACQSAVVHSRHNVVPVIAAAHEAQPVAGRSARLRIGNYSVAGLTASVAERRWPLMQGYSVAHRYDFDLADEDGERQDVRCVLITVKGDEVREGRTLQCTVGGSESWQVELSGRSALLGAVIGLGRRYEVAAIESSGAAESGYHVLADSAVVATLPADSSDQAWIAPGLERADRSAVAATVVALLVGRDLGRGGM